MNQGIYHELGVTFCFTCRQQFDANCSECSGTGLVEGVKCDCCPCGKTPAQLHVQHIFNSMKAEAKNNPKRVLAEHSRIERKAGREFRATAANREAQIERVLKAKLERLKKRLKL